VEVLRRVGDWTHRNAEAIYGSSASTFAPLAWGECTAKPGALFFHVLEWPAGGVLRIPGLSGELGRASLLGGGRRLTWKRSGEDILIQLPESRRDEPATVVKLEHGTISVRPERVLFDGNANIFEPATAQLSGNATMRKRSWMQEFGNWKHAQQVEGWTAPGDAAEWPVRVLIPGDYRVTLTYVRTGKSGRVGQIELAGQKLLFESHNTGTEPRHDFTQVVGVMHIAQGGTHVLRLAPAEPGDEFIHLRQVVVERFE
jgi:alpha-L-fucosidase